MNKGYDIIIVGAGPAGSTAAMHVAKKGYKTLLIDKYEFPRDKSCGDGLTRTTTKLLHQSGILHKFSAFQKIYGAKVFVEDEGSREFDYPEYLSEPAFGLVVPRFELDNILHEHAIETGADFISRNSFEHLLYDERKKVCGVKLSNGDEYFADLVIGADGAASKVAYQTGLASTPKNKLGFGLRGYYKNIEGLTEKLEIYLPILDSSNSHILPSYGWVFPAGNDKANIGVGLMEKTDDDNIHTVMEGFVRKLKETDPRFANMKVEGKFIGAPMRFDFKPENTFAPGVLLVGDAAGLISPFTGEGIGYAIETGMIAADFYMELKARKADFMDLSGYGKLLASKYQGYFETGINSVNRYQLVWKVLKNTFQNDKPLFNAVRQATVFPEGIGESFFDHYTQDVSRHIKHYAPQIRTDMLTISENLINITRSDWPFLSRLFSAGQITPGIPFRPSLFLLLSGYTPNADRDKLIRLGTAIELGFAASICHESVIEDKKRNGSPNWGNMISILLGDFLLSKSFETISLLDTSAANMISESLGTSNQGMVLLKNKVEYHFKDLSVNEYIDICYQKNKYSFELFMQLGSLLRKTGADEVNALRGFGKHFGTAYFIIEDTLKVLEGNHSNVSSKNIFHLYNEQLSLMHLLSSGGTSASVSDNAGYCFEIATNEMDKAISKINNLPDISLSESLKNLGKFVLTKIEK